MLGRFLIRYIQREIEYSADAYSVKIGYGQQAYMALIRNFAQNLDIIFKSEIDEWISSSHPSLLKRLNRIEKLSNELQDRQMAPELHLKIQESSTDQERLNRLQPIGDEVEMSSVSNGGYVKDGAIKPQVSQNCD